MCIYVFANTGGQKRALDPRELELPNVTVRVQLESLLSIFLSSWKVA